MSDPSLGTDQPKGPNKVKQFKCPPLIESLIHTLNHPTSVLLTPMEPYAELIKNDVFFHDSSDTSSWPSSVVEFEKFIRSMLRIPSWFEQNLNDSHGVAHLDRLSVPGDALDIDLWGHDATNDRTDKVAEQRQRAVFNTALADCARIRAVVEAEDLTNTPFPKESFLAILVRNAILEVHPRLSLLEDVPVILPRHFSGAPIPILKYMRKRVYATLIASVVQVMPVKESQPDVGHQLVSEEATGSECGGLFEHEPPTLSEWLDACEAPETPEESEDEQEEGFLSSEFEASFLAYPPSATPPSLVYIPVLCMGDEDRLPVLMTSLLYQRRVWHIGDPLVGLEFSKYSTTIRLFVGWLEEDLPSSRALPRVHLGEVRTPSRLDLSLPSVALVVSRFLCSLESHIQSVCDSPNRSLHTSETRSHLSFPWRIDTDVFQEGSEFESASISESNDTRDMIIHWVETQRYSASYASMVHSHKQAPSRSSPAASSATPQDSASTQSSHPTPPSQVGSKGTSLSVPTENQERASHQSHLGCSTFANTTKNTDYRMFRWMFDRWVVPRPIPSDLRFRDEYSAMTGFIWPETWKSREDLPSIDPALEPCVQELLESVAVLKMRPGGVKCIPVNNFPVDLRVLEQSFSAIFQASCRSHEKTAEQQNICEAAWRHDHDRLLFDFFVRLVQPRKGNEIHTPTVNSVAHLEDPFSRPILETSLRLPKSDNLQISNQEKLQLSINRMLYREVPDIETWLQSRAISPRAALEEARHSAFVTNQWDSWVQETDEEAEKSRISSLSRFPCRGICDALGRLVVKLPNLPPGTSVDQFTLVVRPTQQTRARGKAAEIRVSSNHSAFSPSTSKSKGLTGSGSADIGMKEKATRYTIPSSSTSTSIYSFDKVRTGMDSSGSVDALARGVQRLQLGTNTPFLELPILAVEYKKASEGLMKGTNQLRMYLTASVKFLQAIGIMNTAVYGVQTDGPIVVLPAAIVREDKFVYLFERLVEKLDISTPIGAWHYATILCRLAQNHAQQLEEKFNEVRDDLVTSLRNGNHPEAWTLEQQQVELGVEKEKANRV